MKNIPDHIAIIPDGNRRWAKKRGLTTGDGHDKGVSNFRDVMDAAFKLGIPNVTFWGASEDNLTKRSRLEVRFLVALLRRELTSEKFERSLEKHGASVRFVGRWNEILRDAGLAKAMHGIEARTARLTKHRLTILFGYNGTSEMLEAVRRIRAASGREVSEEILRKALWTGHLPPVDLVIRTGEERSGWSHWSAGFMMWQAANAVLYFTKKFWPEFSPSDFKRVLRTYATQERRFGK